MKGTVRPLGLRFVCKMRVWVWGAQMTTSGIWLLFISHQFSSLTSPEWMLLLGLSLPFAEKELFTGCFPKRTRLF